MDGANTPLPPTWNVSPPVTNYNRDQVVRSLRMPAQFRCHHTQRGVIAPRKQCCLNQAGLYCQHGAVLRIPAKPTKLQWNEQQYTGTQRIRAEHLAFSPAGPTLAHRDSVTGKRPILGRNCRLTQSDILVPPEEHFTSPNRPEFPQLHPDKFTSYPAISESAHDGLQMEPFLNGRPFGATFELRNSKTTDYLQDDRCQSNTIQAAERPSSQNAHQPSTRFSGVDEPGCVSDKGHTKSTEAGEKLPSTNFTCQDKTAMTRDKKRTTQDEAKMTDHITPTYHEESRTKPKADAANGDADRRFTETKRSHLEPENRRGMYGDEAGKMEGDRSRDKGLEDTADHTTEKARPYTNKDSQIIMQMASAEERDISQRNGGDVEGHRPSNVAKNNIASKARGGKKSPGGKMIVTVDGTTYFMSKKRWRFLCKQQW